jgi:hypothetical protein
MDRTELIMREEHPPHRRSYNRIGLSFPRILLKVVLFVAIFILSFHLFHPDPGGRYRPLGLRHLTDGLSPGKLQDSTDGIPKKETAIQEILRVLEKYPTGLAKVTKEEIAEVIYEEATRYNQDPKFILALIATESSFQNWSVSEQGAKGLMQIMPFVAQSVAREMGIEWSGDSTLFNPFLNIRMGICYLSQLIVDFNDFRTALTAYNYGPTYVKGLIEKKEQIPGDFYRRLLDVYASL